MKKETIVYVRYGSPWITENCPSCGTHVRRHDQQFCAECGQELSHAHFRLISETGGTGIAMTGTWTRCVPDDGVNREAFLRELEKLERIYRVHPKDGDMLKIMREAYIRNCFDKENEA